jgi:cytochrome oxidase assembly protein ShyY1
MDYFTHKPYTVPVRVLLSVYVLVLVFIGILVFTGFGAWQAYNLLEEVKANETLYINR